MKRTPSIRGPRRTIEEVASSTQHKSWTPLGQLGVVKYHPPGAAFPLRFFFLVLSSLLLSSSTREKFYPQRPCGQAVVTGVCPSPRYMPSFLSRILRVQRSRFFVFFVLADFRRILLTLALSRARFSPVNVYASMTSARFEPTTLSTDELHLICISVRLPEHLTALRAIVASSNNVLLSTNATVGFHLFPRLFYI